MPLELVGFADKGEGTSSRNFEDVMYGLSLLVSFVAAAAPEAGDAEEVDLEVDPGDEEAQQRLEESLSSTVSLLHSLPQPTRRCPIKFRVAHLWERHSHPGEEVDGLPVVLLEGVGEQQVGRRPDERARPADVGRVRQAQRDHRPQFRIGVGVTRPSRWFDAIAIAHVAVLLFFFLSLDLLLFFLGVLLGQNFQG